MDDWSTEELKPAGLKIYDWRDRVTSVLLCIFMGSIPFEAMRVTGSEQITFTIAKFFGYLLFAWLLLNAASYFRFVHFSVPLFGIYLFVGIISDIVGVYGFLENQFAIWLSTAQLVGSFFLFTNLFIERRFRVLAVKAFGISGGVAALLMVLGITTTDLGEMTPELWGRSSAFGVDPNIMAINFAFASIACTILAARATNRSRILQLFALSLIPGGLYAIVQTASRTGILAVLVGGIAYALTAGLRKGHRIIVISLIASLGSILFLFVSTSEITARRVDAAVRERDTSFRMEIWKGCADIFLERPVLGYGLAAHRAILAKALDAPRSSVATHNTFLTALVSGGILGGVPFLAGWIGISVMLLFRLNTSEGASIAAVMAVLLVANVSLDFHNEKMQWIVLAIAAGFTAESWRAVNGLKAPCP